MGLFLALLTWQGKRLVDRIDAIERNQVGIMVHLGVKPAAEYHGKWGLWTATGGMSQNRKN